MGAPEFGLVAVNPFTPNLYTIRQNSELTMIALGVGEHPALRLGNHLRWQFDPRLGFPERGFQLFRRLHVQGAVQVFSFAAEPLRSLAPDERFGAFRWLSGHPPFLSPATIERFINDPQRNMLVPGSNVNTCSFDSALGALRRVVIELVHDYEGPPDLITVWGTFQQHRVAGNSLVIASANRGSTLTLTIEADALDGFQFNANRPWFILSIGYTLVSWDAASAWTPLLPDAIGLPVTAPGYRVPHNHGADTGTGQRDWLEAADRMSPTGQAADLPAVLANHFGPPEFLNMRRLMRDALARRQIEVPEQNNLPSFKVDPIRLLLLSAIDPRVAAMLGLAWIDRTGEPGVAYDYLIAGFWYEPIEPSLDRLFVPRQGTELAIGSPYVTRAYPRGSQLTLESRPTTGPATDWPIVTLSRNLVLDPRFPVDALTGLRIREHDGSRIGPRPPHAPAPPSRRLFQVRLGQPPSRLTVQAKGGDSPWAVLAVLDGEVVAAAAAEEGSATLELRAERIDTLWIGGASLQVDVIGLQPVEPQIRTRQWISYNVVRGPVPTLEPTQIAAAETVPGFARGSRPEQMVAILLEPEAGPPAGGFFPKSRLRDQPVSFNLSRRSDGNAPHPGPEGEWLVLNFNQETALVEPIIPNRHRLPLSREPEDWPPDSPHYLDSSLDPSVRWYSYRASGSDLFGRTSQWSDVVNVDAADRWGPPLPADVRARWIERGDPRSTTDDLALLEALDEPFAIRLQWNWPENLRAQAPDTARFRVYWNPEPFEDYVFASIVELVNTSSTDSYEIRVQLPVRIQNPPADAFAGDWLRQGHEQYRINASTPLNPSVMTLTRGVSPTPNLGECSVSVRGPGMSDLDQTGNPLRQDSANSLTWNERVLQGPLIRITSNANAVSQGAPVEVVAVSEDSPRVNVAIVELEPAFRWDDPDLAGWVLSTDIDDYAVLGGQLGAYSANLLVDITGREPPTVGPASLQNREGTLGVVRTDLLEAQFPISEPFRLRGGTAALDILAPVGPLDRPEDVPTAPRSPVIGYRTSPRLELVVATVSAAARVRWWPGYEAFITNRQLAVSAERPASIGVVGVSAVDDRVYRSDVRVRSGEPTAPGNEGPIQSTRVRRAYFGRPTTQAQPDSVAGPDPLWAPEPEPFSGVSRFALRWDTAGATRFHVSHATLNAILVMDLDARRARRGLYVGAAELDDVGLANHRAEQAALDAQGQRALAGQYPEAFSDSTAEPIEAGDARWTSGQPANWLRWFTPLDGRATGRHFLRLITVDAAGNRGDPGPITLPIIVPDVHPPLAPVLRRAIAGDRCVWLNWTADSNRANGYRVYRIEASTNSDPPLSSMQLIATQAAHATPPPLPVVGGRIVLPNPPWNAPATIYLAENYDPDSPPDAQAAAPIPAGFTFGGTSITGLDLRDGTLVYVVAMSVDGIPFLVRSPSEHAFCDHNALPHIKYFYRITAYRDAIISATRSRPVASRPSDVVSEAAYDASRPQPPPVTTLTWDGLAEEVVITWSMVGVAQGTSICVQRFDPEFFVWRSVSPWLSAAVGRYTDSRIRRAAEQTYRLRVRDARERVSDNEPPIGSIVVP